MKSEAPTISPERTSTDEKEIAPSAGIMRAALSSRDFLGGGEMGDRIRNFEWDKTPVGPIDLWPQSLMTCVRIMLASRQPIWVGWGPDLIYFYNDSFKAIIGGRHPLALGKPAREVWPELWELIEPMLQRAMAGTESIYLEEQLLIMQRHGFREETYYTISFTPIPNGPGIGGIICLNSDVTRRVIDQRRNLTFHELASCAAARSMEEACKRLGAAMASNSRDLPFVLVYLFDPSGQKLELSCSHAIPSDHPLAPASLTLGSDAPWPVAEVLKSNTFQLVDVTDYPDLPPGLWGKSPDKAVVLPLVSGGEDRPAGVVIVGLNPFRPYEKPYQLFISLVVSQIAAAVANARGYEGERKSFEREQIARREAENAMRVKDQFLATLSHELRTPLNPVLLIASEAVEDPDLPASIRRRFEVVLSNVEVEAQLIDDLLDLSRVTYGKLNLRMRVLDVHCVLQEALQTVWSQADMKGIQISVDLKAEHHKVLADSIRLQQIFWNILRNAVKFTPEQGTIGIETSLTSDDSRIAVKVTDSGIGMTPEELGNIFAAFVQGEHTKESNYGGMGLGLAISKRLVDLHSGSIYATSKGRGHGSTFTIELPLAKV